MLNERQMSILTYITEHGEAKNTALQSLIGDCSMMTLWRDLTKLEQEGRDHPRPRRCDCWPRPLAGQEANFTCRAKQNVSAKEDIARIAADLVYPGHAYYLDAGSTILTLTYFLHEGSYTVVTSAANHSGRAGTEESLQYYTFRGTGQRRDAFMLRTAG